MASIDLKILTFLYRQKIDNNCHDVSVIFSFKEEPEDITGETDMYGNELRVINSYSKYKQTLLKKTIARLFRRVDSKDIIDDCVISLEEKGFVEKLVKGQMTFFELGPGDDYSYSNNSICRITTEGIKYYEQHLRFNNTRFLSILSLIIAIASILISLFSAK
ncbi:MAG: hypothetical protein K0M50_21715 [Prolixibacteraceae bacterium]|nr:hypothetical protein [Prolixibacteraceae bacterium]